MAESEILKFLDKYKYVKLPGLKFAFQNFTDGVEKILNPTKRIPNNNKALL